MKKISDFIIEKRLLVLTILSLISDLLPQGHEYIKVHNSIRAQFGGANTVNMVLQVREGDIFNPTTLKKTKDITDELYFIPGVDRFKIMSIAVNKMVDMVQKRWKA